MPEWCICPKCEHVFNIDKKICDKCGYQLTDAQIAEQKNKKREHIAKENDRAYISIVLIILILVGGVSYLIMKPSPPKPPEVRATSHKPTGAIPYQFAKLFVKDRLKSPKTAEFAPFSDAKCEPLSDGKTWQIYSYVDSQNSFGAMLRTGFYVKLIEDGPNWKLLDIVFMNQ